MPFHSIKRGCESELDLGPRLIRSAFSLALEHQQETTREEIIVLQVVLHLYFMVQTEAFHGLDFCHKLETQVLQYAASKNCAI